ncbi:hypothetical protein Tco_1155494 [Tanacetum coccineum]
MAAFLEKSIGSEGFHQVIDFLSQNHISYALTKKPEIYISFIKQFWRTAEASTDTDGEVTITTIIDGQSKTITEASLRRHLKLEDNDVSHLFPTQRFLSSCPQGAFTKLILRIKKLEATVKTRKARKRERVVLSEDEEDDSSKQGRIDEEPNTYFAQDDEIVQLDQELLAYKTTRR